MILLKPRSDHVCPDFKSSAGPHCLWNGLKLLGVALRALHNVDSTYLHSLNFCHRYHGNSKASS